MFTVLIRRAITLITKPQAYWEEVVADSGDIKDLLIPNVLILAAVPALAQFIGVGLLGGLGMLKLGLYGRWIGASLVAMFISYLLNVGLWLAFGFIIDALAKSFGAERDLGQSMKLATGAVTPMWLGQILLLTTIAPLGWLGMVGGFGYGCYLLYVGLPLMNGTPDDKAVGYTAATMGCLFVVSLVAGFLVAVPTTCCMASAFLV